MGRIQLVIKSCIIKFKTTKTKNLPRHLSTTRPRRNHANGPETSETENEKIP